MSKTFKKVLSLVLATLLLSTSLVQSSISLFSFADGKEIEDKVLFQTSFEENDGNKLLSSTLDDGYLSNVIKVDSPTGGGKGLEVLYETIKGSEDYLGSECKYNLFDGKTGTKYLSSGSKIYVSFALKESAVVRSYSIASANDEPSRDPKNWTLYGSVDGIEWITLDQREGISFSNRQQTKSFGFTNKASYKFYKFEVESNGGASLTQFSNLDLFTEAYDDGGEGKVDSTATVGTVVSFKSSPNFNSSEIVDNIFDGSTGTKWIASGIDGVWVSVKLKTPIAVNTYQITVCNDHHKRDPKNWNFYGSNDGEEWVLLDSRSDEVFKDFFQTNTYKFENTTEYSYYKLGDISCNGVDNVGLSITHMSELKLMNTVLSEEPDVTETPDEEPVSKAVLQEFDVATVKGSATLEGSQGILQIFDGSVDTKVCVVNVSSLWVSAKLKAPAAVNTYKIASANDHDPRDPRDWTLYGSNDGEAWVALDVRTNEDMPDRNTYYTYTFNNTTPYSYYKLDVSSNNGEDAVGLQVVQFSEWQLFVDENAVLEESKDPVKEEVDISTIKGSDDMGGSESKKSVFDGQTSTKVCAPGSSFVISFALKKAAVIKGYAITSANDHISRSPKKWVFYGSNDGENWSELDRRTGVEFSDYFEEQIFAFSNDKSYLYYKLDVLENGGNSHTQFSELSLFSYVDEALVPEEVPGMVTDSAFGPIATE